MRGWAVTERGLVEGLVLTGPPEGWEPGTGHKLLSKTAPAPTPLEQALPTLTALGTGKLHSVGPSFVPHPSRSTCWVRGTEFTEGTDRELCPCGVYRSVGLATSFSSSKAWPDDTAVSVSLASKAQSRVDTSDGEPGSHDGARLKRRLRPWLVWLSGFSEA